MTDPKAVDYRRLFDAAPTPYLILAADLTIVEVNEAYLSATSTQRHTLLDQSIFTAFPDNPDDQNADGVRNLRRSLETVLATAEPDTMALQRYDIPIGPDGHFEERYWSPINTPILDDDARITHIIHRVQDVTAFVHLRSSGHDRQQAERALARAEAMEADLVARAREVQDVNRQLRHANEELAATSQALREQQEAKDRFIATLSHELRNPLAAIQAAVELLALDILPDHPALAVLQRQTAALIRMTDDLLSATRVLTGRLDLVRQLLDLREVVQTAAADVAAEFAASHRALRVSLPGDAVPLDGDRIRLAQLLGNLLSNAGKYTQPGATVTIDLSRAGAAAVLVVRDDGIGFAPAAAETLFEVFTRAVPSGTTPISGLGLGLAIVRNIAELHGGSVTAHSDGPGTGAEFRVRLPLSTAAYPGDQPPPPAERPARRPLRVLVIEDNTDLAATYRAVMHRHGDTVTVATTGHAGLAEATAQPFDLVLCDIGLPDIDGYQIARRLRDHPATRDTKLVAVSGFSQDSDRQQALHAGFDAHLAKPMTLTDLESLLNSWSINNS
ncbi:MAG TPA: ATP-binding protein [Actinophytocola sp.]|uniref:ATP-binding protein n=1 Tax=Actinophytocola sp. TaxID=1872138 RepID=UPI002DB8F4D4|nr:ATP-binding protein [Actinophytocola sp.]HEU5474722.1 ATP-binding protein [Actinophytocola sp.]